MENLIQGTNRKVLEVQSQLEQLSRQAGEKLAELEYSITETLKEILSSCERLDVLAMKEPAVRRQSTKMKVDQLKYDYRHLDAAFRTYLQKRRAKEEEERRREELLTTRFRTNAENADTAIMIDQSLQHHNRLTSANKEIDSVLSHGSSILGNLKEQRFSLKGIQKKMTEVANTLGLSNTVMRLIDKRGTQDKWILYGGMIVTCIIMFLVVKYLS